MKARLYGSELFGGLFFSPDFFGDLPGPQASQPRPFGLGARLVGRRLRFLLASPLGGFQGDFGVFGRLVLDNMPEAAQCQG